MDERNDNARAGDRGKQDQPQPGQARPSGGEPGQPRRPTEGVRIIGAEEAQAAIEAGHAAGRRPDDAPRFGDVPRQPEGPRPAIRFPLGATDPSSLPRPGLSPRPGQPSEPPADDEAPAASGAPAPSASDRPTTPDEPSGGSEPRPSIWAPPPSSSADDGPPTQAMPAPYTTGTAPSPPPSPPPPAAEPETGTPANPLEPPVEAAERGITGMTVTPDDDQPVITPPGARTELPHWTEPPTGENPRIGLSSDDDADDLAAWQPASGGPRWRGEHDADWEDVDAHDPAAWAEEEGGRMGALDPDRGVSDLYRFDEPYDDEQYEPARATTSGAGAGASPYADSAAPAAEPVPPRRIHTRIPPAEAGGGGAGPRRRGVGRDVPTAIATGLGIGALLLVVLKLFENVGGVVIAMAVLTIAAAELFNALRLRGFRPATLLGVAGTAAISWGAYARGEQAVVLITALFGVFALLWYLLGVSDTNQKAANAGVSIFAFAYVGVLGSTAALMLKWPPNHAHGMGLFLGAIIATVAYDVGGFAIGSRAGHTPLAPEISPNKTWEGLIGGIVFAVLASVVIVTQIEPWTFKRAIALGLVAAVAAPLGDLCESMLKRDLGIKDMGSVLPAHGGVLDRIDAMLFVIPAVYYLAKLINIA